MAEGVSEMYGLKVERATAYRRRRVAALLLVGLVLAAAGLIISAGWAFNRRMDSLDSRIASTQAQADELVASVAALEASVNERMDELAEELITRTPYWDVGCYCEYLIKTSGGK